MQDIHQRKNGQAMVEFLLGLVSIVILLMGINQIAAIVYWDFTTITAAREEVADDLMGRSAGSSQISSDVYNFGNLRGDLENAVNANGDLKSRLEEYPSGRETQMEFLWDQSNPLQAMVSEQKGTSVDVASSLMRRVLGRSTIQINNAVYMPPWEDILGENQP